jgi:hypothetical protein
MHVPAPQPRLAFVEQDGFKKAIGIRQTTIIGTDVILFNAVDQYH